MDSWTQQPVTRRQFLKMGGLLSISLLAQGIPGFALRSMAAATPQMAETNKLIVIMLRGAVDGVSALVPYGDPNYYAGRPNIGIAKPGSTMGVLPLDPMFGLNPNLSAIMPFWQKKQMSFVISSGSPILTRSHFDAQDYMESGTPGNRGGETGWMNRFLTTLPNNQSPMRGLNVGNTIPRIYQGPVNVTSVKTGMNPLQALALDNATLAHQYQQMYEGDSILQNTLVAGLQSRQSVLDAYKSELLTSSDGAPAGSEFVKSGSLIARLIGDDPKVQAVFVSLGGWDTHVNQGNETGSLAGQLKGLGDGLALLMDGLTKNGNLDRTTIVVMSEFGRTARENGNKGTDHGYGNTIWLLGGTVDGGRISGSWDGMATDKLNEGRDLPVTTDFRVVFGNLFQSRYGFNPAQINAVFPNATGMKTALKQSLFKDV